LQCCLFQVLHNWLERKLNLARAKLLARAKIPLGSSDLPSDSSTGATALQKQ
jgi:hypothetical protein